MTQETPDIETKLRQLMPTTQGPMARAIKFVLAHREDVPFRSMRELAKRAAVPPVTLVRLAQRLGFKGFEEFRELYVAAVMQDGGNQGRAAELVSLGQKEGALGFAAQFADGEIKAQRATIAALDEAVLDGAVRSLAQADRIFVVGRRPFFAAAYAFSYALRKAKPNTLLLDGGGGWGLELEDLTGRDVLVGFTAHPYSRITLGIAASAKAQGAAVIAVTDSEAAPIAALADHMFLTVVRSYAFPDSTAGAALIGNILVALTVSRLGPEALTRIQRNEREIRQSGEYVVEPARGAAKRSGSPSEP
jgi:DNA-binding MurR/RpiR family transcriptional regulator